MTVPTDEAVTLAGSGLTFINNYDSTVTDAYRSAIITAENFLQSHFTNQVTISASFTLAPLGANAAASNNFGLVSVSYAAFKAALASHATTADDFTAVNGLPTADPSGGLGFEIPVSEARILGLAAQSNTDDVDVTLNSKLAWTFGADAEGAIIHELTEGGFGRIGSLGIADSNTWEPMDLFRFTATGVRDFTGGADQVTTYFGLDSNHVTGFTAGVAFHSSVDASGTFDGADLADWGNTHGDSFGPGGPNSPGSVSALDLQVLDVLGWNSTAFVPAADDFANHVSGSATPFGHVAIGGTATGTLEQAGDRDLFQVTLQAGATYTITENGHSTGQGTLADPFLRIDDAAGNQLAFDDDIVSGSSPDSSISFTPTTTGTYYIEAGAFADGYAGTYTIHLTQTAGPTSPPPPPPPATQPTAGDDSLQASASATEIHGGAGNDTLVGWSGGDFLTGDDGDDSIQGGSGFDRVNGNKGEDTIDGGAGGNDWLLGGQGNDQITAHASDNILNGNIGDDTVTGGAGNDTVHGGQGNDILAGGPGNDFMSGDLGDDTMTGGAGADTFHGFAGGGTDVITDFNYAEGDRVQVDVGSGFTLIQSGADVVVNFGGGSEMIVRNTTLANLPSDWIFTA